MTSSTRLKLSLTIIVVSAVYAVMVAEDPRIASAVALGYISLLLTLLIALNLWKKP